MTADRASGSRDQLHAQNQFIVTAGASGVIRATVHRDGGPTLNGIGETFTWGVHPRLQK
jgi:hypothetical protein